MRELRTINMNFRSPSGASRAVKHKQHKRPPEERTEMHGGESSEVVR